MKTTPIDLRILRKFSRFREVEKQREEFSECCKKMESRIAALEKKAESDKQLIASLNRYITMLEGKSKGQAELIAELKDRLNKLSAVPGNQTGTTEGNKE